MSAPENGRLVRIRRILDLVSLDRLACFSAEFDTAHPAEPWNSAFRQELETARKAGELDRILESNLEQALGRHFWNAALCASLYPPVHAIEICYRNAFDLAVRKSGGSEAWLEFARRDKPLKVCLDRNIEVSLLGGEEHDMIEEARRRARERYRYGTGRGLSHSDILAELDLGFWVRLTNKFPKKWWPKTTVLLNDLIPEADATDKDWAQLLRWLQNAQELRNAISHQHILWVSQDKQGLYYRRQSGSVDPQTKIRGYLKYRHDLLYFFLEAINKNVCRLVESDDRFDEIRDLQPDEFLKFGEIDGGHQG